MRSDHSGVRMTSKNIQLSTQHGQAIEKGTRLLFPHPTELKEFPAPIESRHERD